MTHLRPLAAIRAHKQVSRASVSKALKLPVAKIEYFEDHAPLTTLEYLLSLKRSLGLSWATVGAILDETIVDTRIQPAPVRGRGRPRKNQNLSSEQQPLADQVKNSTLPKIKKPSLSLLPSPRGTAQKPSSQRLKERSAEEEVVTQRKMNVPRRAEPVRPIEANDPAAPPQKRPRGRPRKQPDVRNMTLSGFLGLK